MMFEPPANRLPVSAAYAPLTIPMQPPQRRVGARKFGAAVLAGALTALAGVALWRGTRSPRVQPLCETRQSAAGFISGASAILSFSVLADSSIEHYRGAFQNPAMYVAPIASAVMLANCAYAAPHPERLGGAANLVCSFATVIGVAGVGFHIYNVTKREGGIDWLNLFYGAPVGAPFALALAGLAGLAAAHLVAQGGNRPMLLGKPAGQVVATGSALALLGTVGEAALMHFRGAYHDPFMYVPVTLPAAAAAALGACVFHERFTGIARMLLKATLAAGLAGVGSHLFGISRNMGGFKNLSQNLLNGPPLPAPPSFTGVALAGLAGLRLMEAT